VARKGIAVADADDAMPNSGHGHWTREGVKAHLERRYSTRLHMAAILAASGLVAMLASSILLYLGVTSMMVRYPAGIALSYLTFLTGVFVWLRVMGLRTNSGRRTRVVDAVDVAGDVADLFEGDGAPASFAAQGRVPLVSASMQADDGGSGAALKDGLDLSGAFDGEAIVLLLLAVLLVLVVFATSGYLIWMGPDILAEAAFGALLAGGLARRTKEETAVGWIAGVVKKTWWPFAVVLVASLCFAAYAAQHFPEARTFKECLGIVLR
jgi:hypothetical protein